MTAAPESWNQYVRFWFFAVLIFCGLCWVLQDILAPFVTGIILAYILNPLMERMAARRIPRHIAASILLILAAMVVVALFAVLVPLVYTQSLDLVVAAPDIISNIKSQVMPYVQDIYNGLSDEHVEGLKATAQGASGKVVSWFAGVAERIWSGGVAFFDIISFLIITPVVIFYLLRDWDLIINKLESWMPRTEEKTLRNLLNQINQSLSGFIRGQASVCLILGIFYALGLSWAGLKFGLVIGLAAGILSFIPYVGSIVGGVTAFAVALFQFGMEDWQQIGLVLGIFVAGQILEGVFLSPKLIGDKVGLHPLWIVFVLMAGGSLFGFVGVLLAIPVAAIIGVLSRFFIGRYLESSYYKGTSKTK